MKIKTLRLATSYIDYLINVLKSDDPNSGAEGFKADIHKKWNEKTEEQKRKELVSSCLFLFQPEIQFNEKLYETFFTGGGVEQQPRRRPSKIAHTEAKSHRLASTRLGSRAQTVRLKLNFEQL